MNRTALLLHITLCLLLGVGVTWWTQGHVHWTAASLWASAVLRLTSLLTLVDEAQEEQHDMHQSPKVAVEKPDPTSSLQRSEKPHADTSETFPILGEALILVLVGIAFQTWLG